MPSRALRPVVVALLALLPLACGDDGDGGDDVAADEATTTTGEDGTTTTTEDELLTTGTTASTATEETTTTPPAPTTRPPATNPPTTTPTTASGPRVTSLAASPADCDGSGQTTLTWATSGAVSVDISIDNEGGVFRSDLPPSGSAELPGACFGDTQVYFVRAFAADGSSSTRSVTATSE